ncbi:hypothetical protein PT974_11466 [Cladobotryum mycophilum]|uniref:Uncharacterized protein n=1 Tax=Cladobotryum mycophilum TaxID=491253 RepID=A0ABR0S5A9_9HYPO
MALFELEWDMHAEKPRQTYDLFTNSGDDVSDLRLSTSMIQKYSSQEAGLGLGQRKLSTSLRLKSWAMTGSTEFDTPYSCIDGVMVKARLIGSGLTRGNPEGTRCSLSNGFSMALEKY